MGHRIRMTAEIGDWLAGLRDSEPLMAAEVGAALVAVLESAGVSDLDIVGEPGRSAEPATDDPRATADYAYQRQLEHLQQLRRRVADVATLRRGAELRLSEQQAAGADAAVLEKLEQQLTAAQQREAALAAVSQRVQHEVDAFRIAKETAKARFTAAEASLRVAEAVEALGEEPDPDLAQRREDYRAAEERLRALNPRSETAGIIREGSDKVEIVHPGAPRPGPRSEARRDGEQVPGVLEVRADPLGSDIRVLFALEPSDAVTLLAVLEGPAAVSEHGTQAITLAGDLLTEIRGEGWPADLDEVLLAGPAEFVARFFPADDGGIVRRAEVLAAMTNLSKLRADLHLTVEEVADRSGLPASRIRTIEREGLRIAHVHEAVALARALGARLELPSGSGPVAG